MSAPERPINTFYAFCSLVVPGLGQLLQKRPGAAIGFFAFFILTGLLPFIIVSLLVTDRFSQETLGIYVLHVLVFLGVCFPMMLAFFCAIIDAAAWKPGDRTRFKPHLIVGGLLFFLLLVFLLFPFVPSAREAAMRVQCLNNMRQIVLAFQIYHDKHGHLPSTYTVDEYGKPLHSWRVLILPYIEQNALYEKIRLDEPWDSEYNRQFHVEAPSIFRCPSAFHETQCPTCRHERIPAQSSSSYSIIDGTERTLSGSQIILVERRTPVNWMDPSREITFETALKGINVDAMGISSYHANGVNAAFGAGNIRFIPDSIDNETLRALLVGDETDTQ